MLTPTMLTHPAACGITDIYFVSRLVIILWTFRLQEFHHYCLHLDPDVHHC